ncbi:MAG: hypothetical protein IJ157_04835 [Clostridia bacterium]|nr:hypothetical protein [Clostridia bacterium]
MTCKEIVTVFQGYLAAQDGYIPGTAGEVWTAEKQRKATDAQAQKYGAQWIGHHVEDCSGAFVRAYKAHNLSIYHGSNRIAREYVAALLPISQAMPGMATFKAREPGEKNYALPAEYQKGGKRHNGDMKDYYHIGLVDADGQHVINAQSTQTGVVRSNLSGWDCVGYLKAVEYEDKEGSMSNIKYVYTNSGDSVFLRQRASQSANYVCRVPIGSQVEVMGTTNTGWSAVKYGDRSGYMMSRFLVDALPEVTDEQNKTQEDTLDQARAALYAAREAIDNALALLSPAG